MVVPSIAAKMKRFAPVRKANQNLPQTHQVPQYKLMHAAAGTVPLMECANLKKIVVKGRRKVAVKICCKLLVCKNKTLMC